MLRMSVSTEEYLMIGDNVKLIFLGGTGNHLRIMVDAPRDINIVRSSVLEKNMTPQEREKMPRYYAEPKPAGRYLKPRSKSAGCKKAGAE